MTLMNIYILYSYQIPIQSWINNFQGCLQYSLVMNSVDGIVLENSCCSFWISLKKVKIVLLIWPWEWMLWFEELLCSFISDISVDNFWSWNFFFYIPLKTLYFFINKLEIRFLWQRTLRFSYTYSVPIYKSLFIFDDKMVKHCHHHS